MTKWQADKMTQHPTLSIGQNIRLPDYSCESLIVQTHEYEYVRAGNPY
jgi:hypothetical protein